MTVPIDMSEAFSWENQDTFDVIRRSQVRNNFGEPVNTEVVTEGVLGVVDAGSPNEIAIGTDEQHFGQTLSIVTQFLLRGTTKALVNGVLTEFAPDIVKWSGSYYKVVLVEPYQRYGRGWIQAQLTSQDYIEQAPKSDVPGAGGSC